MIFIIGAIEIEKQENGYGAGLNFSSARGFQISISDTEQGTEMC